MLLKELWSRFGFWRKADRIGPDIPLTHWRLYFKSSMRSLATSKFFNFGINSEIRPHCYIVGCSQISIGDNVTIRPLTMLHGETDSIKLGIVIEDNVLIGSGVHIYVENHKFDELDLDIIFQGHSSGKQVVLKRGCWIGANAIILPGVTIGENSVVGAGSVVTKSIPDRVVAVGSPARIIKVIGAE